MMVRCCEDKDMAELISMLKAEGLKDDEMDLNKTATFVVDEDGVKGFFSIRMEQNMPYLVHLCVKRESRTPAMLWKLSRYFKNVVRSFGYQKAIINTPKGDNYLSRLVSRYFHVRPYAADNAVQFYLVEV